MSQKDWIEKDFYKVLGVPKDASQDDIKKAFRKLAKKNHPGSNENDPKAEARFKEASEAYDVLSSETKRKEYDEARSLFGGGGFRMPPGGFNPNAGGQGGGVPFDLSDLLGRVNNGGQGGASGGFGDVLGGLFNRGGGARSRARRGADIESTVTLSFDEALDGVTLPLRLTSDAPCGVCSGTGARNGTTPRVCPTCQGAGQVNRLMMEFHNSVITIYVNGYYLNQVTDTSLKGGALGFIAASGNTAGVRFLFNDFKIR